MRLVQQILASYVEIDRILQNQLASALIAADRAAQQTITLRQRLNDNAYFVLVWGQFENEINARFRQIVSAGKANPVWAVRRHFSAVDPDRERFETRLALLVDKDDGRTSGWSLAMRYYGLRNRIAHGDSDRSGVLLPVIVEDLYVIQSNLASA